MGQIHNPEEMLEKIIASAQKLGVKKVKELGVVSTGDGTCPIMKLSWRVGPAFPRILLSAGIHGDEPAGPHSVLSLLENWVSSESHPLKEFNLDLFPLINPSGFLKKTRENKEGIDLNREFAKGHPAQEVRLLMDDLKHRTYHLSIELHEDIDAKGFYLYEHFPEHSDPIAPSIISCLEESGHTILKDPIIEGMSAQNGIIHPSVERRRSRFRRHGWPEAIYMHRHGTPRTITLETPTCKSLEERIDMHKLAFGKATQFLIGKKGFRTL
ncbi:MAG: M14 family metallopeptidase [Leptospirales bacterium]